MRARASADKASADTASAGKAPFLPTLLLPTLLLPTLYPPTAFAVEVDPLRLELTAAPRQTVTAALTVVNHREEPVRVTARTGDYRYMLTAQTVPPRDPVRQRLPSAREWLSLEPAELPLAPHASGTLTLTVTLPAEAGQAGAGEYVASLLVDERPEQTTPAGEGTSTITVVPRVAVPVYLLLDGQTPKGRVAAFAATAGPQRGLVRLLLTLANDGAVHLRPTGTVLIADDRQEVVHRTGLGRTIPIFPQFQEGIPILVPLAAGRYSAVATVDLGGGELVQRELAFVVSDDGRVREDVGR